MKIAVFSDIHNEFLQWKPDIQSADVVVLAGDIHSKHHGINWAIEHFDVPVIYVPGNHEYYGCEISSNNKKMKSIAKNSNVHVLINDTVEIDGILFIGTTLWTDFLLYGKYNMSGCCYDAENYFSDYSKIRIKEHDRYRKIKPADTQALFAESLAFIEESLTNNHQSKCVVVTHHAPSIKSISPKYNGGDMFSASFTSNLEDFIHGRNIDLWLHGHTHHNVDYIIGNTRIVSNQRGYPNEESNQFFDENIIINI